MYRNQGKNRKIQIWGVTYFFLSPSRYEKNYKWPSNFYSKPPRKKTKDTFIKQTFYFLSKYIF